MAAFFEKDFAIRVLTAESYIDDGIPLKDIMSDRQINEAIRVLAIYVKREGWYLEPEDDE